MNVGDLVRWSGYVAKCVMAKPNYSPSVGFIKFIDIDKWGKHYYHVVWIGGSCVDNGEVYHDCENSDIEVISEVQSG